MRFRFRTLFPLKTLYSINGSLRQTSIAPIYFRVNIPTKYSHCFVIWLFSLALPFRCALRGHSFNFYPKNSLYNSFYANYKWSEQNILIVCIVFRGSFRKNVSTLRFYWFCLYVIIRGIYDRQPISFRLRDYLLKNPYDEF